MSNVLPLFDPLRTRIADARRWFMDQAMEPAGHVAALSVAITADGMVNTKGCGIEPEHAEIMLEELRALVDRLEGIIDQAAPSPTTPRPTAGRCLVIPLRR